ncbi:MAG: NERD domain-containing protein [Oscillospiraceae bacterium]|jgi:predicted RNA-binding Zn-ribbon protein involved in translation (DUF1610 family)|nr:NERD domain-containing protein [Oscillospiraceae bacterium]
MEEIILALAQAAFSLLVIAVVCALLHRRKRKRRQQLQQEERKLQQREEQKRQQQLQEQFLEQCRRKDEYERSDYFLSTQIPYRAWDIGEEGEYQIGLALQKLDGYKRLLFNVYLPKENGLFSEIDIIMIHTMGIFVIESKNFSGWIFGDEDHYYWTQSLTYGQRKEKFYNPCKQNISHIKALQKFMRYAKIPIYSAIVFSDSCELMDIEVLSKKHVVMRAHRLPWLLNEVAELKSFGEPTVSQLTKEQIETIYKKLFPQTQLSPEEREAHSRHVANIQKHRICPYCGNTLILRTAKETGRQFYGCLQYPKCHYTAPV